MCLMVSVLHNQRTAFTSSDAVLYYRSTVIMPVFIWTYS